MGDQYGIHKQGDQWCKLHDCSDMPICNTGQFESYPARDSWDVYNGDGIRTVAGLRLAAIVLLTLAK